MKGGSWEGRRNEDGKGKGMKHNGREKLRREKMGTTRTWSRQLGLGSTLTPSLTRLGVKCISTSRRPLMLVSLFYFPQTNLSFLGLDVISFQYSFLLFFHWRLIFCLGFLDDVVYLMLWLYIALFLPVSEPGHPVPEQVKESGRTHTDCELLQPQDTAFIGGLLVLPFFFFLLFVGFI